MALPYVIKETEDYYPLSVLFHESGMEIEISETPPEGMVKMWRMENVVFDVARKMGIKELWGSAKVPDYYYRLGWERMDRDTSPQVAAASCHTCSRRGKQCFPQVIRMIL